MEFIMINFKILSAAAVIALVLPMAAPVASFAQDYRGNGARPGGGVRPGGGGAGVRQGGGNFHGGGAHGPRFSGGGYRGGGYYRGGGGGAFIPGIVAGAVIGGAIASQGGYGGPGYYAQGYYDDQGYDGQGYDDGAVAVAPAPGGDDGTAYCMQTYRSYDPQSGTYMGYDGARHPCP
jgi:BA14K-like protein